MTVYNGFTKGQAGVIFKAWKDGKIAATKEQISYIYNRVVGFGVSMYDNNLSDMRDRLKDVVEFIFKDNNQEAQAMFNSAFIGVNC